MSNLSSKQYNTGLLPIISEIVDIYWISEFEFVIVDHNGEKDNFSQTYCHVDHDKCCIVPFRARTLNLIFHEPFSGDTISINRGFEPALLHGKQYHVMIKSRTLLLVPWNIFHHDNEPTTLKIIIPLFRRDDRYSTCELAFCYGHYIYIPLVEKKHRSGQPREGEYPPVIHRLLQIDLRELTFNDDTAITKSNSKAMLIVGLNYVNLDQLRKPKTSVKNRQCGEHLLVYTTAPKTSCSKRKAERTIYTINLRELSVSSVSVDVGENYCPTVYRDHLFIVKNEHQRLGFANITWSNKIVIKPIVKKQVSSLKQLAQVAHVRYSIPIEKIFEQFVFPNVHVCLPTVECFCDGILKATNANMSKIREIIRNGVDTC